MSDFTKYCRTTLKSEGELGQFDIKDLIEYAEDMEALEVYHLSEIKELRKMLSQERERERLRLITE